MDLHGECVPILVRLRALGNGSAADILAAHELADRVIERIRVGR